MLRINIHQMKTNLSRHLDDLAPGDRLLICRRNVAVAEVRRLPEPGEGPRRLGLARGEFTVPPSFFEPLPPDVVAGFEGDLA
ncbi:MAG: type II toxin-antitoxin system Phd/YefM family antitoxin [Planctomycetes bacterium]|nr:type II toxin-antitoxin system Phd/YefM family antitoxin [Planctomycetota bacterium]